MAIITLPSNILFGVFEIGQRRFDLYEMSDTTGNVRTRVTSPPRWVVTMGPPQPCTGEQGGLWAGLIVALQGSVNVLATHNPGRPTPLGTVSGGGSAARGATSMGVSGTVKAGDCFQVGSGLSSQFIIATQDSSGTLYFGAPLRQASSGLVTNKPLLHCKMMSDTPSWSYDAGSFTVSGGVIELMEYWEY